MLNTWAQQRKLIYSIIFGGVAMIAVGIPAYVLFYAPPSCTDGKKNIGEAGVDCGGSCRNLCQVKELAPVVVWTQKFMVSPGVYSAVAYIENPNVVAEARNVPYTFKMYDGEGQVIAERSGTTFIPAHKKFAIFEGNILTGGEMPARIDFEFTKPAFWVRQSGAEPVLSIGERTFTGEDTRPRIEATLTNGTVRPVSEIGVVAIVYSGSGNAIAASATYVDVIEKDESKKVVFTWPNPFPVLAEGCEVPVDVMLAIDRSGSMDDDGTNPSQPLSDVKAAAASFLDRLKSADQAGVVSFGTTASEPVDAGLSNDFGKVQRVIRAILIKPDEESQGTNIADGIIQADKELQSERHDAKASKVIVLLTDGVATEPTKTGDESYPEKYALSAAAEARDNGSDIYTIGLGNKINEKFLEQLASAPEYFFSAVSTKNLNTIYRQIGTAICKSGPTRIELIPTVLSR